jgi:hypothetical protein
MGRSLTLVDTGFLVDDAWGKRSFTGAVTLVIGESDAGKSTGFESLWYVLGLPAKLMPAARACGAIYVTFDVDGVRWRATRGTQPGNNVVEFVELGAPARPPVRRSVKARNGEQSAEAFFQELLAIPRSGTRGTLLGMEQVLPWLYLRQGTITTSYLDGMSSAQRRLVGRALLGAHDAAVEELRADAAAKKSVYSNRNSLLNKLNAARAGRGLLAPDDIRATLAQAETDHAECTRQHRVRCPRSSGQ